MMAFPTAKILIGQGLKTELDSRTGMVTTPQIISSKTRKDIVAETPGVKALSDRIEATLETVSVTKPGPIKKRIEVERAEFSRRGTPLLPQRGKRRYHPFPSFKEEKMKKLAFLAFLIMILNPSLMADSFSLSLYQNMTDNLFQNSLVESDQLSSLSFYVDKNLSRFSVFSEGTYSYLYNNPNLTYYLQDVGLDYLHPLNEKSAVYFSLGGRGAFYRSDFSDYNYLAVNFFTAFKSYTSPTSIINVNYSLEYKNYKSSLFDSLSQALLVSFDKYFQTRTTFKGEISWGYKFFLHPFLSQQTPPMTDYPASYKGRGKGRFTGGGYSPFITKPDGDGQGIQVFSLSGLIAQGLGNKIGLNLTGMRQWTLSGENPFTYIQEFYSVENPSYDRFSWFGTQWGSQLTILMPWNIQFKLGYTRTQKEFPGIESLNLEGESSGITREDRRKQVDLRAEKNFPRFSLYLSYYYIMNHSNDPFFEWTGHFFSVGIEWNFLSGGRK